MVKSSVRFGYVDRSLSLGNKRVIQKFIIKLVNEERRLPCRLQYVFCSDEYLHGINYSFLNHNDYTDIITFDISENPEEIIVGEIYISVDRVEENAVSFGVSFASEVMRVIIHGALHLCGYKDKRKMDKVLMRSKEDYYLQEFPSFVSRETQNC